jgi:hypothetical protein
MNAQLCARYNADLPFDFEPTGCVAKNFNEEVSIDVTHPVFSYLLVKCTWLESLPKDSQR